MFPVRPEAELVRMDESLEVSTSFGQVGRILAECGVDTEQSEVVHGLWGRDYGLTARAEYHRQGGVQGALNFPTTFSLRRKLTVTSKSDF